MPEQFIGAADVDVDPFDRAISVAATTTDPNGIEIADDGAKLYLTDIDTNEAHEYDLATAFDVTTASYVQSLDVSPPRPEGLAVEDDGAKLYVVDSDGGDILEYDLATPFDLSTASLANTFDTGAGSFAAKHIRFNPDGSQCFQLNITTELVETFDLTTPWDTTTASAGASYDHSDDMARAKGLAFNVDGTEMYIVDNDTFIVQYTLGTPFDVTTATVAGGARAPSVSGIQGLTLGDGDSRLWAVVRNQQIVHELALE